VRRGGAGPSLEGVLESKLRIEGESCIVGEAGSGGGKEVKRGLITYFFFPKRKLQGRPSAKAERGGRERGGSDETALASASRVLKTQVCCETDRLYASARSCKTGREKMGILGKEGGKRGDCGTHRCGDRRNLARRAGCRPHPPPPPCRSSQLTKSYRTCPKVTPKQIRKEFNLLKGQTNL